MYESNKNHLVNVGNEDINTGKTGFKENIDIFKCPVCDGRMHLNEFKSLVCLNNHCFDISRKGHVNLMLKSSKYKYDKEVFESRNKVCHTGFFDPLTESIVSIIDESISGGIFNNTSNIRILDAGCGDGYHLFQVVNRLQKKHAIHFRGVGVDISKDGILIAARNYKGIVWCVADLAKLPFMDNKFDIILNILSPSNYSEFNRITRNEGILIKVVPGSGYLKELRNTLYQGTDREAYSNEKVIEHFSRNFEVMDTRKIVYSFAVNREELGHIIKMTPLSWGVKEEIVSNLYNSNIDSITADFTVIAGKSKLSEI